MKNKFTVIFLFLLLVTMAHSIGKELAWDARYDLQPDKLQDVAFGYGGYIAVGESGEIKKSKDAKTWTLVNDAPFCQFYSAVTYGYFRFVAVGIGGKIVSLYGDVWSERTLANSRKDFIYDIIYVNGKYTLVGGQGLIQTSNDGITWTDRSLPDSFSLYQSITYGNGFYAVLDWPEKVIISTDGIDWSRSFPLPLQYPSDRFSAFLSIGFGNGLFVAVGYDGCIFTSSDCSIWTDRSIETDVDFRSVAYGNNLYVVVGDSSRIYTSPNAIDWVLNPIASRWNSDFNSVICNDTTFVVVGEEIRIGTYRNRPKITTLMLNSINNGILLDTLQCTYDSLFKPVWFLIEAPVGFKLDYDKGIANWMPADSQIGSHTVKIRLSDGGLSDTATYNISYTGNVVTENKVPEAKCDSFSLVACPNPFNPSVSFSVGIPESGKELSTSIELYSISGALIQSWQLTGYGYKRIQWKAQTPYGNSASSNMFIVKASNGSNVLQQKLIYLK